MKPTTLKALKASIAHWRRLANGKSKRDESVYAEDCALCGLFCDKSYYAFGADQCDGCPVKDRTGLPGCKSSPWRYARIAYHRLGKASPEFRAGAKAQLAFLESLLPKAKRK